ncbi:MAG: hypothetical protein NTX24_02180 [Candidatus Pacearchaeota archaeon]|nr:hypothetical protein [Candidatus Pacearchaeota archaeon]
MNAFKYIFLSVIILVLAMTIFSYVFNPFIRYQVNGFILETGNKVSSLTSQMKPTNFGCEDKAKQLIPKYWFSSDNPKEQELNYWTDGTRIETYFGFDTLESCLRIGTQKGENIDYRYYSPNNFYPLCEEITYSKQVISQEGNIKGYINFTINPVFKRLNLDTNYSKYYAATEFNNKLLPKQATEVILHIEYKGFNDTIKEIFHTQNFSIGVYFVFLKDEPICKEVFTQEDGTFECVLNEEVLNYLFAYPDAEPEVRISPQIFNDKIYEIVSPNFKHCEWVE